MKRSEKRGGMRSTTSMHLSLVAILVMLMSLGLLGPAVHTAWGQGCGNGYIDEGEECGEPGLDPCPEETPICCQCQCLTALEACGNGYLDEGEQCEVGFECPSEAPFCYQCKCLLAIVLAHFEATRLDGGVKIDWGTASEIDTLGFNLLRSESEEGPYSQINESLIPGEGGESSGAEYTYIDTDVEDCNCKTYWYKLEEVDIHGVSTLYGPVFATHGASTWGVASQAGISGTVQSQSVAINYLLSGTLLFVSVWLGIVAYRRKR